MPDFAQMWQIEFIRNALVASVLVGLVAPLVGIFVVQRRLSMIGDGLGHVALAGVAVGLFTGNSPVWMALLLSTAAAILVEVLRARAKTSGDVAIALMFYGGIAAGVVLLSKAPQGSYGNINEYLFGSILTTTREDLQLFAVLAGAVVLALTLWGTRLFAVNNDEEYARAVGLPVTAYNIGLAILTAATVVLSMRVIGLLLISGLMVLPVACAQLLARSFRSTVLIALALGVLLSTSGPVISYVADTPPGATVVLLGVISFAALAVARGLTSSIRGMVQRRRAVSSVARPSA